MNRACASLLATAVALSLPMAVSAGVAPLPAAGGAPVCIAVPEAPLAGFDESLPPLLEERLRAAGVPTRTVLYGRLADESALSPATASTLVLTDSPRFPVAAFANLLAYLRGGGDVILMGGHAFRDPILFADGRWQTVAAFADSLARDPDRQAPLFRFEDPDLSRWRRGASNPAGPSRAATAPGPAGAALLLELRDVTWYDVFGTAIDTPVPGNHDALCLWAKADPATPQVFVEITERDGTRWSRALDVTSDWAFHVLPESTFLFKADGAAAGRGGPDDRLRLASGGRLTVGLARDRTPVTGPAHSIWVDEIATTRAPEEMAAADGGLPFREAFDDAPAYRLERVARVAGNAGRGLPGGDFSRDGSVSGTSALGFETPHESVFVPLLSAEDSRGRLRGRAAGMLLHCAGPYAGSQWGLFGVEDPAFYRDAAVLDFTVELIRGFRDGGWLARARREEAVAAADRLPLTAPPLPPLAIRDGHFVLPDGRRFFMIGVNFWNSFDTFYGGGVQWDVRRLGRDFERMERAGINAIRIHGFNRFALAAEPHRLETFLELCRRHRIYVLAGINLGKHEYLVEGKPAMQAEARRLARLLRDESAILGYDLQNEPYWWEVAQAPFDGQPLGERFPVPAGAWDEYFRSLRVCEGNWTSTFPGLDGPLPVPEDPRLRQAYDGVNGILGTWIGALVEAIRGEDPNHAITVGYNTIFDCLPANEPLDFVSHHVYEDPLSPEHVRRNLTTMDRLRRLWPDRPVTLGEFGYSNGDVIAGRELDPHTQSVGEITHWLYALAHGFDGAMKWQLCDATPAYQWRFATWHRDTPANERARQRRFGMYRPDGSPEGHPKPIVHATRFLRECLDAGLAGGTLELRPDPNLIGTGYVYRGENVLFVGGSGCDLPELRVEAEVPVNVMLRRDGDGVTILATADARVRVGPPFAAREGYETQLWEGIPVVVPRVE